MKRFTAWRLQSRLLLSYLIVLAVGITVVAVGVQLVGPPIFDRALGEHMVSGGAMHERITAAQQDGTVAVFRTAVFQTVLLAALAATIVAVAASLFVARRIAGPVTAMARASRQMAAGQYNMRVEAVEPVELAELATSLNHLATALEEAEGRRVTLIGDVAHEIRTPLTTLRGNLEGLIDGIIEPSPELFATLHDETGRLTRLVDDLQQLSRVEAGDIALKIDRTVVRAAVDRVVTQVGASFAAKGVALRLEMPAELPGVRADEDRLVQILTILLANALRHTPAGGTVTIGARERGGRVELSVADTGTGIAPEHLPHVFERFYRADAARSRSGGGSGIGLTIARALVEAQDGSIRAESPGSGRGATFTVSLLISV